MNVIEAEFAQRFPSSQRAYAEAVRVFPSGITHDSRYLTPFPLYVERAAGSRKWDLDGNELIDYWVGHGALLLGHNHPVVLEAVRAQLERGTHYGASHELEVQWGRLVQRLVPSAEKVRFVSSGTEATLMALRLARAASGRVKIARFAGHYHGWHDSVALGYLPPFDIPASPGIPDETLAGVTVLPPNDVAALERALAAGDIAAVILEPAGGANGTIPTRPGFLEALRQLCDAHNSVLIFDEVITGFRYAPGGAQEYFGVTPDLTTLAKIVSGGLPGGAVAGKAQLMDQISFTPDAHANRHRRMLHQGTFNANPLSAAAGVAMLSAITDGRHQAQAGRQTLRLIDGMNERLRAARFPGCVYGDIGAFHLLVGQREFGPDDAAHILDRATPERLAQAMGRLGHPVRAALLLEGVDTSGPSGRLASVHSDADLAQTLEAFERALARLRRWGAVE
jgi:glutamate-1-semialdehyde 2,1-aminomutase